MIKAGQGEVVRGWLNIGLTLMLLVCVAVILGHGDAAVDFRAAARPGAARGVCVGCGKFAKTHLRFQDTNRPSSADHSTVTRPRRETVRRRRLDARYC